MEVLRNGSISAWWVCGGKWGEQRKELEMRLVDLAGTRAKSTLSAVFWCLCFLDYVMGSVWMILSRNLCDERVLLKKMTVAAV